MSGVIYKLTFPNGKIYIGKTVRPLKVRLQQHANCAKNATPRFRVHQAWKKYGPPMAQVLVIVDIATLDVIESRAIKVFQSFGAHGYNMTPGGETSAMLGKKHSVETRNKMSGKKCSDVVKQQRSSRLRASWGDPEYAKKMREMSLANWRNPEYRDKVVSTNTGRQPMLGKNHSLDTKRKMSELRKGKAWSDARRAACARSKNV